MKNLIFSREIAWPEQFPSTLLLCSDTILSQASYIEYFSRSGRTLLQDQGQKLPSQTKQSLPRDPTLSSPMGHPRQPKPNLHSKEMTKPTGPHPQPLPKSEAKKAPATKSATDPSYTASTSSIWPQAKSFM